MGSSETSAQRLACQFYSHSNPGETPIFRTVDYSLDAPLPDEYGGIVATLLQGFEYGIFII